MPSTNAGALQVEYVTVDVTSLGSAGAEPASAWKGESDIDRVDALTVVGQEGESYHIGYDHLADEVFVLNASDGSDVSSGTDVGEIKVRLEGRS